MRDTSGWIQRYIYTPSFRQQNKTQDHALSVFRQRCINIGPYCCINQIVRSVELDVFAASVFSTLPQWPAAEAIQDCKYSRQTKTLRRQGKAVHTSYIYTSLELNIYNEYFIYIHTTRIKHIQRRHVLRKAPANKKEARYL